MKMLNDKKVLVTGGSRGLGRVIALEAAKEGAEVHISYRDDEKSANETLKMLTSISNREHGAYKFDVVDYKSAKLVAQKVKVDIIINNAGVSVFLPISLMEEEDWDKTLDTNLKGSFLITKAFLPSMIQKKGGAILNIGSLAGMRILAAPVDYCSSKAGLKGFTESLAKELGRYNIRVNALAPGILEGGVARGIPENKMNDFMEQLAIKRECSFYEVARASVFMVSDLNSYMSGQAIIMDGGL